MICVENDAKVDARCHTLKIDIRYLKSTKIDAKEEEKEEVSEVISVENDAKVDARCHTLKIDIRYLKCTKFDAKEKKEKKERMEKIGMNLLKSPFLKIEKIVYTKKKSNLQVKNTDHMEVPCILTKQKLNFWPKFPSRANQKIFTPQEIKFYFITY